MATWAETGNVSPSRSTSGANDRVRPHLRGWAPDGPSDSGEPDVVEARGSQEATEFALVCRGEDRPEKANGGTEPGRCRSNAGINGQYPTT